MEAKSGTSDDVVDVRALVEAIVRAIVDHPDQVFLTEVEGTQSSVLELSVAPDDVGKVIGKKGIHADAIRRIVHAIGGKTKKRYVLEILEHR
ncbi:MAG: KH domain-containing protein [Myxococcota bacterium]